MPGSGADQPAELPAQTETVEKKREATQPIEIAKATAPEAPAWFSEIASFNEKNWHQCAKNRLPKPNSAVITSAVNGKIEAGPNAPTGAWNTKPTGAGFHPLRKAIRRAG
jgi:hypothetical protein